MPAPTPSRCWPRGWPQSDPPDTFQAHAGAELNDYIDAGQIEDLSAQYQEWGLTNAFPQGLIDNLTVDGKIYSVPANIHRANVIWGNKTVLASAGITKDATTLDAFFADLDKLKAKGVTPLALGQDWTQLMLFESVLISDLGAAKFTGLWNGSTKWDGADVTKADRRLQEAAQLHQHRPRHVRLDRRGETHHGRQGRLPAHG